MQKTETPKKNNIKLISMHDEMSSSYLSYAMSVIVSRALPDVRDGLKPVHRRILYAMYKGGYDWSKQFRKSARIVGDVIGKYHPHGDQSVYDALVRMVQDFSMSLPLVQGQGNFGSIDGDPAAAMRYTETRLSKVSQYLIDDIEKKLYKDKYQTLSHKFYVEGQGSIDKPESAYNSTLMYDKNSLTADDWNNKAITMADNELKEDLDDSATDEDLDDMLNESVRIR